ncbi:MAG: hypothetical protein NTW96_14165 [Planctomycetia bacterium]|nr:hypothetical protein [Planctomycetia bacterium]
MVRHLPALILSWFVLLGSLPTARAETAPSPPEKAVIAFRIGTGQWMPEARFRELLELFERHKGVTDQITFFHSFTHSPVPLDEVRRRAEVLRGRVAAARKAGYRSGINVLTTMGHHVEDLPHTLGDEYPPVMDIHGSVCAGSRCPNGEKMREYVRELYQVMAGAEPDFLWIDDDVRLAGHMPLGETCFCDRCLAIFEQETGNRFTRESLAAAFTTGGEAERLAIRKAWVQHNRDTIARLFTLVEETVHKAKPGLPLGFMTGDRFYEGYDFDRWAGVLSGPGHAEVWWRPGGGFYNDEWMPGLAQKSHAVGRQVAVLPDSVVVIQSEIENFPYQRLMKSAHVTALEAASHIAAGCTGAAFNVLSGQDESLEEFEPLVEHLHARRPFFDLMVRHLGRTPLSGIAAAWNKDSAATSDPGGGNWSAVPGFLNGPALRMFEIGLPAAFRAETAPVVLLSGDMVHAYSDEELRRMLSKGVYMDVPALEILNRRGLKDLTGFEVDRAVAVDGIEQFREHPLNGPFAGRQRDCRQSFNHWTAHLLRPLDPKAESLSTLIDYGGAEQGPCVLGIFENRLGGRVSVAGYFPWTFLHSLAKSAQMKAIMRWLSQDRLPGYVASFHKTSLWIREPRDGQTALAMSNDSLDPAENVVLLLRTDRTRLRVFDMDGRESAVDADGADGPYRKFVLPRVGPWEMRLLVTSSP